MKFKHSSSLVVLATAALLLAACSGSPSDDTSSEGSGDLSGTLTFANWQWLEPSRGDATWAAVSAYSEENPDAKLEKQEITRADYEKTMSTQLGAGGGPDILVVPDAFYPPLVAAGLLEPLDDVLGADQKDALRPINKEYVTDDKQLALVWNTTPYALFWNKKLTDAADITSAPKDMDELIANAKAVQEKTGKTGFVVRHQLNEETPWWTDFSNWPFGFGGKWSDGEKLTIDDPKNIEAAEAFKSIYDSGAFGVGDDGSTYRSKFAAGEVGYVIDNAAALQTLVTDNTVVTSTDVDAAVLPFPGGSSASVGVTVGINAHSKNKDLAKDFMRWMFTADAQEGLADSLFPAGVGTGATASDELIAANPWVESFYKQSEDSQSVVIKGFEQKTPQISHIVLSQIQKMLTGGVSAKEALEAAQKEAEALP